MAKRAELTSGLLAKKGGAAPAITHNHNATTGAGERVSLTLKLDQAKYEQLRSYAFKHRLSHQAVMESALDLVLK